MRRRSGARRGAHHPPDIRPQRGDAHFSRCIGTRANRVHPPRHRRPRAFCAPLPTGPRHAHTLARLLAARTNTEMLIQPRETERVLCLHRRRPCRKTTRPYRNNASWQHTEVASGAHSLSLLVDERAGAVKTPMVRARPYMDFRGRPSPSPRKGVDFHDVCFVARNRADRRKTSISHRVGRASENAAPSVTSIERTDTRTAMLSRKEERRLRSKV